MADLQKTFREKFTAELQKELGIKNSLAIPRLLKIVISLGLKEALTDKKVLGVVGKQLTLISGQKPIVTKAKKSISAFKLWKGAEIGLMITLRGKRMYDFLEKLVAIVLPRVRDFHGVKRESFDGCGNYNLGLKEQIVFPEIDYQEIDKIRGLQVTIVTSAKNNQEGQVLLEKLGMPFVHAFTLTMHRHRNEQGKPQIKKLVPSTKDISPSLKA